MDALRKIIPGRLCWVVTAVLLTGWCNPLTALDTPTPSPSSTAAPTVTPGGSVPEIDIGNAGVDATNHATVTVSLASNGATVGGTRNSIVFDNTVLTLTASDCTINPAIGLFSGNPDCLSITNVGPCKNLSRLLYQCGASPEPLGCPPDAGANLTALTATIAATAAPNTNAIPDGTLYTCTFTVANVAGLPGTLTNNDILVSDPTGHQLCSSSIGIPCGGTSAVIAQASTSDCCQCPASCAIPSNGSCGGCTLIFGAVCESGQLCVPNTPGASGTPTPTVPTSTPTISPIPTASPTPTPTRTPTPGANDCCQCAGFCAAPIAGTCGGCVAVLGASCAAGSCVTQAPTNTPSPSPTSQGTSPTLPSPTPAQVPSIDVGSAVPDASNHAIVTVSLTNNGANVGGTQNSIVFDNTIVTLTASNCAINPAIGLNPGGADCISDTTVGPCKNLSKLVRQCGATPEPQGCPAGAGTNLSALTAIVAGTAAPNTNPVPDGPLYTCTFTVTNAGALPTTLTDSDIVANDPTGHQICSASGTPCGGSDGTIFSIPTPTSTNTLPPSWTPTPTETATCAPTGTPYCSNRCPPSPTLAPGCYAPGGGWCMQNPQCASDEVCAPFALGSDCCSCATFTPTPSATPTPTRNNCTGDCNDDNQVTVDEIVTMVNLALNGGTAGCAAGDANRDGQITVDEIVTAVNYALNGCPVAVGARRVAFTAGPLPYQRPRR